jgi:hypothetical protein
MENVFPRYLGKLGTYSSKKKMLLMSQITSKSFWKNSFPGKFSDLPE